MDQTNLLENTENFNKKSRSRNKEGKAEKEKELLKKYITT